MGRVSLTRIVINCIPKQFLPQSDYDAGDKEIFERRVTKYRKLLDGAKEGIK